MSPHTLTRSTASPRQISYIKVLAMQTGTTFTPPRTWRQADSEIRRLKALKTSRGVHREVEQLEFHPIEQPYATEQKPGEVIGYGATARRADPVTRCSTPVASRAQGEPLELGHYETEAGEKRALYGIRVEGRPRIIDAAAEGRGRIYTVEEDLCEKGGGREVKAIVTNYIADAQRLGRIPMARIPRSEREPVDASA